MCSGLRPGLEQRMERSVATGCRGATRARVPGPLHQAIRRHVPQDGGDVAVAVALGVLELIADGAVNPDVIRAQMEGGIGFGPGVRLGSVLPRGHALCRDLDCTERRRKKSRPNNEVLESDAS